MNIYAIFLAGQSFKTNLLSNSHPLKEYIHSLDFIQNDCWTQFTFETPCFFFHRVMEIYGESVYFLNLFQLFIWNTKVGIIYSVNVIESSSLRFILLLSIFTCRVSMNKSVNMLYVLCHCIENHATNFRWIGFLRAQWCGSNEIVWLQRMKWGDFFVLFLSWKWLRVANQVFLMFSFAVAHTHRARQRGGEWFWIWKMDATPTIACSNQRQDV